ncbi:hypothetical protein ABE237_27915 [Brevibacillus formosus]|uniref:hypothetical protein n=1 Tax=Brevibacillus TaxID=55080 RepID=UPI0011B1C8F6|nr:MULTISPECIES: hypothetical protein [Brevibacillus]MED1945682.1 hypothetical protein [Brevibacillus formosus]MED2000685.1 hypothetical protein [Brevibacillus formosus]MED2084469.1 hypothetical protein [Brevibacillus formosus]
MRTLRFFSAAGVAFLVSAVLFIISMLTFISYQGVGVFNVLTSLTFMLAFYLLPFCFVGCLIGELVYSFTSKIVNRFIVTLIFVLTGIMYSYLVHRFLLHGNSFVFYLCLSVLGSTSFYWAHFINNIKMNIQLALIPGYVITISLVSILFN